MSDVDLEKLRNLIRDEFGTLSGLARAINVNRATALSWFRRALIPAEHARAIHDVSKTIMAWDVRPDLWKREEYKRPDK